MKSLKKGFTLIELLIVIGILAVLATVTVLVLNPAQLFAQARDSQRLADLGSIKGAISLYMTTKAGPDLAYSVDFCRDQATKNYWGTFTTADNNFNSSTQPGAVVYAAYNASHLRTTDGLGWVPVKLDDTTGGSPLSTLPIDPTNPNTNIQAYTYSCDQAALTFELNANMESSRYGKGGDNDVESTDGGSVAEIYEIGIDPGLNL